MIEIVFSDSAYGCLKMAQSFGKGEYRGGCMGVILSKKDGSQPTQAELEEAQREMEERDRLEWENATPMGGSSQDVFGFQLLLSIGDISPEDFASTRQATINTLWSIYPSDPSGDSYEIASPLLKTLESIREHAARGEDIRIWYSNQPDEYCGLYWLMAQLRPLEGQLGSIFLVKLPEYEYRENNTVVSHASWGEISPGEWHRYTALAEATTPVFRQHCAAKWLDLQTENAPLRAVLNGKLVSVPEDIYDAFILREIAAEQDEFSEANVIGRVLGKYQLGIGDAWVAHRIEKMIASGKLVAVSNPPAHGPSYHRKLKKK